MDRLPAAPSQETENLKSPSPSSPSHWFLEGFNDNPEELEPLLNPLAELIHCSGPTPSTSFTRADSSEFGGTFFISG